MYDFSKSAIMEKSNTKKILVSFGIIMMLATSPLGVNFTQAEEIDQSEDSASELTKSPNLAKKLGKGVISERIVDGKLNLQYHNFNDNTSFDDLQKFMMEGETNGWAYVSGKAFKSGIVLYNGKVAKVDDKSWQVTTEGTLDLGGRTLDMELSGKVRGSHMVLHGTASNDELNYRVVFSGKVVETDENGFFALSFMKADLKDQQTGETIKMVQLGQIVLNPFEETKSDLFITSNSVA